MTRLPHQPSQFPFRLRFHRSYNIPKAYSHPNFIPTMYTKSLFVLSTCLALSEAFVVPPGTADGTYVHSIDANGTEVMTYVELSNTAHPARSDAVQSAKFRRANTKDSGAVSCSTSILNDLDLQLAASKLESYCGQSQGQVSKKSSVSYVNGNSVVYVCTYKSNYACDSQTTSGDYGLIAAQCGNDLAGWYNIPKSGISYGYDAAGKRFC